MAAKQVTKKEDYTAKKWTVDALHATLASRGFDENDYIDLPIEELRAQLIMDDKGEVSVEEETTDEDTEEVEEEVEEPGNPAEPTKRATGAKVGNAADAIIDIVKGTEYIRSYSLKEHGSDYAALAAEFLSKDANRSILEAGKLKGLRIEYRVENKKPGENHGKWENLTRDFAITDLDSRNEALRFYKDLNGLIKKSIKVLLVLKGEK